MSGETGTKWGSAGTLYVSEQDFKLFLHELVPGPPLELRHIAELPSPKPATEDKEDHFVTAIWAPHGQALLLQYAIRDYLDDRGSESDENANFEVGFLVSQVATCAASPHCQACMHARTLPGPRSHARQGTFASMQVLYLLEITTQEIKHVTTTYDALSMTVVQWCCDGHILVLWEDYVDSSGWSLIATALSLLSRMHGACRCSGSRQTTAHAHRF